MHSSPAGKKPHVSKKSTNPAPRQEAAGVSTGAKKKPAATKAPTKPKTAMGLPVVSLEPRQQRFVDEYLIDLNATQAAIRAGYSKRTARSMACENLTKPDIQVAISAARAEQQERTQITADAVLREAWNIAVADVRELVQVKVGCCRHCHGEGFRRQRTLSEYNHDREAFAKKGGEAAEFEEEGGIGFNTLRRPNPECPECGGDGQARVVIMDTRDLSKQAIAIYAGAKTTKYGIEVLLNSKDAALEKLFKHLGLYEKDNQQRVDPLASLLHTIASGNSSGFKPVARDPEHGEKD
ncbi:terminase small subunit [Variovorax sp. LjRoot175]|uniref:terminase small subunit n=1 Tax=Variovorax sp. LjRoot175 TaxID=3342276 RepID=UPI003ECE8524